MSRDGLLLHLRKYSNLDNTRLFLTSRLNVDIPRTFSPMLPVEIAASTPDITACLESEMHKSNRFGALYSEDLKQEIIKRSVEKTHGVFCSLAFRSIACASKKAQAESELPWKYCQRPSLLPTTMLLRGSSTSPKTMPSWE